MLPLYGVCRNSPDCPPPARLHTHQQRSTRYIPVTVTLMESSGGSHGSLPGEVTFAEFQHNVPDNVSGSPRAEWLTPQFGTMLLLAPQGNHGEGFHDAGRLRPGSVDLQGAKWRSLRVIQKGPPATACPARSELSQADQRSVVQPRRLQCD